MDKSTEIRTEVAVVGAGIAGASCAAHLAHSQIATVLIDKDPFLTCGPKWVNAVPLWMFDQAGAQRPSAHELFHLNQKFILRSPLKTARVAADNRGVADVNMGALGLRFRQAFLKNADEAQFIQGVVQEVMADGDGRIRSVCLSTADGKGATVSADLFVDAAGLKGVLREQSPLCRQTCPSWSPKDLCTAAQETFDILDRAGAESFLEKNQVEPGDILADIGISGGYSLFRVQVANDFSTISLLSGTCALPEFESAQELVRNFIRANPWIGPRTIKGQGAIPLSFPCPQLAAPGLALLGDAGGQVYAGHGSGIGFGLIAAKLLADTVAQSRAEKKDLGSLGAIWPYARAFHEQYSGLLAFSDRFRRLIQRLSKEDSHQLLQSGLLSERFVQNTLLQTNISVSVQEVFQLIRGVFRARQLASQMVPFGISASKILGIGKCFPKEPRCLRSYAAMMNSLVGFN